MVRLKLARTIQYKPGRVIAVFHFYLSPRKYVRVLIELLARYLRVSAHDNSSLFYELPHGVSFISKLICIINDTC